MSAPQAKVPVCALPLADWPETERTAWQRCQTPVRSPFRKEGGGRSFSPATLATRQLSYGVWLAYLRDAGQLDITASPSSRVTPERLDLYIQAQHARGNRPKTIVNRISNLKAVLDVLDPGRNHRWVIRPRGIPIQRYFDLEPLVKKVHHSAELILWAEKLFAAGLVHRNPRARRAMVRDAVMIGILIMPAPRVGALVQFKLGQNLQRHADSWCIDQDAGITKMGRGEWSPLLPSVQPMLERYLSVERGELLGGGMSDRLWIAQDGQPLTLWGIASFLKKRSLRLWAVVSWACLSPQSGDHPGCRRA
jgi:integrase